MLRVVFGAFLLLHGLVHLAWFAPNQPAEYPFTWHSLLLPNVSESAMKKAVAPMILLLVALLAVAALGVWGVPAFAGIWAGAAIFGALISLVVMALLWHPWFVTGPLVNILILLFAFVPGLVQ